MISLYTPETQPRTAGSKEFLPSPLVREDSKQICHRQQQPAACRAEPLGSAIFQVSKCSQRSTLLKMNGKNRSWIGKWGKGQPNKKLEPGSGACVRCSTLILAITTLSLGEYQEHHSNGPVFFMCITRRPTPPLLGSLKVFSLDLAE